MCNALVNFIISIDRLNLNYILVYIRMHWLTGLKFGSQTLSLTCFLRNFTIDDAFSVQFYSQIFTDIDMFRYCAYLQPVLDTYRIRQFIGLDFSTACVSLVRQRTLTRPGHLVLPFLQCALLFEMSTCYVFISEFGTFMDYSFGQWMGICSY